MFVALIPVPLVNLGLCDTEASGKTFDFLLRPVYVTLKLCVKDFHLDFIHSRHETLAVRKNFVA